MKSDYEEKKHARIERYNNLSESSAAASKRTWEEGHKAAEAIPFGQPILVGHHSEKRDRAYRNRFCAKFDKSIELDKKAKYYEEKANAAESNNAISSDDPNAISKLQEKLNSLQEVHEKVKKLNRILSNKKKSDEQKAKDIVACYEKYDIEKALKLIEERKSEERCQVYFRQASATNRLAEINRLKKRIDKLRIMEEHETVEIVVNGIRIVDNVEDNRLQIFFDEKPDDETRKLLKSSGFRWAPSVGAWQRFRSSFANMMAKEICKQVTK